MKKISIALTLLIAATLWSCSTSSPLEGLVKAHLAKTTGTSASNIKILKISSPEAWLASDSLEILQKEFNAERAERIGHLNAALEASQEAIIQAEIGKAGGFKQLNAMFDETIAVANQQIETVQLTVAALEGDCKGTTMEGLYNRIKGFESAGTNVLYHAVNGKWTDGTIEQEFHVLANAELSAILGAAN